MVGTAFKLPPEGETCVGPNSAKTLCKILDLNEKESTDLGALKTRLAVYEFLDMPLHALGCLCAISKNEKFDIKLHKTYRQSLQRESTKVRNDWTKKLDEIRNLAPEEKTPMSEKIHQSLLNSLCEEAKFAYNMISIITENNLNSEDVSPEDQIFYKKLLADWSRYQAEMMKDEDIIEEAKKQNEEAYNACCSLNLTPSDDSRLGILLNYTVFIKEILGDTKKAVSLAKNYSEEAIDYCEKNQDLTVKQGNNPSYIISLMNQNIVQWEKELELDVNEN